MGSLKDDQQSPAEDAGAATDAHDVVGLQNSSAGADRRI
jgi:hypothetical protein